MKLRRRYSLTVLTMVALLSLQHHSRAPDIGFPKEQFVADFPYPTEKLLQFASYPSFIWQYETYGTNDIEWPITRQLLKRRETKKLLKAFENPVDQLQEEVVVRALRKISDATVYSCFKEHINHEITHTMYVCLDYLAERGNEEALKILNDNYFKYGSSVEWAGTVKWFGKYQYKPAIPNLINSLNAASLNLVDAARESLEQIYQGPHPRFKSIREMQRYFEKLYRMNPQQ